MINLSGRIIESEEIQKVKTDKKDRKILALLSEDSRAALSEIAKKVKLSRDAVDYRIRRLQNKGVLLKFIPVITFKKFGYFQFHTFMLLDESETEKKKKLLNELKRHPSIRNVMEYSDRWDIEAVFLAKTVKEFDGILTDIISKYPGLVKDKITVEVISNFKTALMPHSLYEGVEPKPKEEISDDEEDVDEKDIHIINILSQDGRQSTYRISEKVDLSPDAVSYRIKKLAERRIINKFSTIINLSRMGQHWFTFVMSFTAMDKKTEMKFREFVFKNKNIIRAVKVHGEWDVLLYIVCDGAVSFHSTIREIKREFADVIKNYETWVAYREHVYNCFPRVLRETENIRKVLVFGTFDILHPGHIWLFKEAKKYGDYLTVVVGRDSTVRDVKGAEPKYRADERLSHVSEINVVDQAILGSEDDKYDVIEEVNPDVICLGYDQKRYTDSLEEEIKKRGLDIKIVRLKPYKEERFKSSKLK